MGIDNLTEEQRYRLNAFREASRQMHDVLNRFPDQRFGINHGSQGETAHLLPEDTFVRLLTAYRLVHMSKEPAFLPAVKNIIRRAGSPEQVMIANRIFDLWNRAFKRWAMIHGEERDVEPKQIVETWMYGKYLHLDRNRQELLRWLIELGLVAQVILQLAVWRRAHLSLAMDTVVASILGETPLARAPKYPSLFK